MATLTPALAVAYLPSGCAVAERKKNWTAEAVARAGGMLQAAAVAKVSLRTMYRWHRAGFVTLLDAALRLSKATGIPIQRFARDPSLREAN